MNQELSDKILIEQTKEGKREAFEELMGRYAGRVYSLNFRLIGGNREEAEDLTQEVFISAYQGLSKYQAKSKFFTWLYRIAINTFNASYRIGKSHVLLQNLLRIGRIMWFQPIAQKRNFCSRRFRRSVSLPSLNSFQRLNG